MLELDGDMVELSHVKVLPREHNQPTENRRLCKLYKEVAIEMNANLTDIAIIK
jgi:ribosome-associated protein YbcJ (S4-like RNA binding protein)